MQSRARAAAGVEGRRRLDHLIGDERAEHDPRAVAPRDQERVLAVEADARARGCLTIDVVVFVDEHAVGAAEPAPERVELLAQLRVAVGPRVARRAAPARAGLVRLGSVVAERRRDHGAGTGKQRLGMARDLGPAHREAHPREEAALAPVADVPLGLLVRLGRRRADRIEAELRTEPGQLRGCHDRIVPVKAIRIHEDGGPEVLRYEDVPDPVAGPGEVLVSLRAASLNHLDLWVRKGLPSVPKPRILGADGAGIRVDTGERVRHQPRARARLDDHGDRRAHRRNALRADRGAREQRLPARRRDRLRDRGRVPARLRDGLPDARDESAAPGGRVGADLGHRRRASRRPPSRSPARSARRPSSPPASDEKLERAREWGADLAVNHATGDVAAAAKEIGGVDLVVETVGEATWKDSLAAVKPGGRVTVCGATSGPNPPAQLHRFWWKQLTVYGSTMGTREDFLGAYELVRSGRARVHVDSTFPLSETRAAHERLERGEQLGKIVLTIP